MSAELSSHGAQQGAQQGTQATVERASAQHKHKHAETKTETGQQGVGTQKSKIEHEAGRPGPLAYPQPVWGRQALILKLKEAGRPARPTCLSSSCVGPPGAWPQAEGGGHLVILNLSGAARRLSSS